MQELQTTSRISINVELANMQNVKNNLNKGTQVFSIGIQEG
jgi:hypothetical protein